MSKNKKNVNESSKKTELPQSNDYFRVAQFGCPHSDKDIEKSELLGLDTRYPFQEGVEASIAVDKVCDIYHVLGDWTGLQTVRNTQ